MCSVANEYGLIKPYLFVVFFTAMRQLYFRTNLGCIMRFDCARYGNPTSRKAKMPETSHRNAAKSHEDAAKAHHAAADHHGKGDHKTGLEHSQKAHGHSETAHKHSTEAHQKSSQHAKK